MFFFFWQINKLKLKLKLITVDHRDTTWPTWHWANADCPLPLKSLRHIFNLEFHNIFIVRRCEGDKNCNTGQKNPRTKRTGCRFKKAFTLTAPRIYTCNKSASNSAWKIWREIVGRHFTMPILIKMLNSTLWCQDTYLAIPKYNATGGYILRIYKKNERQSQLQQNGL